MADDTHRRRRGGGPGRAHRVPSGAAGGRCAAGASPGCPEASSRRLASPTCSRCTTPPSGCSRTSGMGSPIEEFVEVVHCRGRPRRRRRPGCATRGAWWRRPSRPAAKEWVWHGFDDDRSITVGGDRVHFGTAGAAVLMYDHLSGVFRPSTAVDVYDCAPPDRHPRQHSLLRPHRGGPRHARRPAARPQHRLRGHGRHHPSPSARRGSSVSTCTRPSTCTDTALGGPGEFRKRPFVAANNTFVVPPMRFAEESAKCMVAQVETGMPINLLSAGQAGATSPAALAGSLAQALAECLARAHQREPDEPRPSLRDGHVALRVGPSHRRHERRLRRGGHPQRSRGPAAQLDGPAFGGGRGHGRLQDPRQPGRLREKA